MFVESTVAFANSLSRQKTLTHICRSEAGAREAAEAPSSEWSLCGHTAESSDQVWVLLPNMDRPC